MPGNSTDFETTTHQINHAMGTEGFTNAGIILVIAIVYRDN